MVIQVSCGLQRSSRLIYPLTPPRVTISTISPLQQNNMASQSPFIPAPSATPQRHPPNKAARATFARHTINSVIPHILQHNPRARQGNESTERIYYSPSSLNIRPSHSRPGGSGARGSNSHGEGSKRGGGSSSNPNPNPKGKITGFFKPIAKAQNSQGEANTSVYPAAGSKSISPGGSKVSDPDFDVEGEKGDKDGAASKKDGKGDAVPKSTPKVTIIQSDTLNAAQPFISPRHRVAVLNMASFLRPGGGVVNGSIAQEESLCLRSTLYTALDERFYRLPKLGGLFTEDVLVFRDVNNHDLPSADWYFVDVISVAALKNPYTLETDDGKGVYEYEQDKEEMISKIKLILITALQKRTTHLILGALGCGAYGNPPEEVAKMFRRVIFGDRRGRGAMDLSGIEEIVFAIFDDGVNLRVFRDVLGGGDRLGGDGKQGGGGDGDRVIDTGSSGGGKGKEKDADVEMGGIS